MATSPSFSALVETLQPLLAKDGLAVQLRLWNGQIVSLGREPAGVTLTLTGPASVRRLLRRDLGALAQAYVQGEIDIEGPVREVVRLALGLAAREGAGRGVPRTCSWS